MDLSLKEKYSDHEKQKYQPPSPHIYFWIYSYDLLLCEDSHPCHGFCVKGGCQLARTVSGDISVDKKGVHGNSEVESL